MEEKRIGKKKLSQDEQEKVFQLIDRVKQHPELWNEKHALYKNIVMKKDLWETVAAEMGEAEDFVHMKWRGLLSSYRRIRAEISRSHVTGSGTADVIRSKWFAFEAMQFLNDTNKPRQTINSLPDDDEPLHPSSTQPPPHMEEEWLEQTSDENATHQNIRPWEDEENLPKRKSRKRKNNPSDVDQQVIDLIFDMKKKMEEDADANKKGNAAIGTYVTARLNELTDRKRNKAVVQITTILQQIADESDDE
uniref:Uncharacterized protein n=1 Tax=Anopheles atroparvus TaxID=41427 RepID=A0A182JJQ2_ANOAO